MFLNRYGFDVKPEMVNEEIVVTACILLDSEHNEKKNSKSLCLDADHLRPCSVMIIPAGIERDLRELELKWDQILPIPTGMGVTELVLQDVPGINSEIWT